MLSSGASQDKFLSFLAEENTPNSPEDPELAQLTETLESKKYYRLVVVGPWDSNQSSGIYAIWQRTKMPTKTTKAAKAPTKAVKK
jgi:hypothetical protein